MSGYKDQWEAQAIKDEFEKALKASKNKFRRLRRFIFEEDTGEYSNTPYIIDPDTPVFDYCAETIEHCPSLLDCLYEDIKRSFSYLFDAYLFHRILTLRVESNVNKIVLFAGAFHSRNTYVHFEYLKEGSRVTGLKPSEEFTPDHLQKVEAPLEEIETKEKPYCVIC